MGHSLNSPSSFSRRIGCPGSANMEKDLPNKSSPYAMEGTAAHQLAENCLQTGNPADFYLDIPILVKGDNELENKNFIVTHEMANAVQTYVDYCTPFMGKHFIEKKFELTFLGEEEKGTADFTALHDGILHVIDYKHGKGVPVEVEGNVQGLCYGLGAARHFEKINNWHTLRITIAQPRAFHEDGPIRSWDVPREDLFDYMINYAQYAKDTEDPNAPLNVGPWCRFCKAKPTCPAQLQYAEEVMEMDFSDPTSKPVPMEYLSEEQLADLVLNRIKTIEQWCQSVKDHAQNVAEAGAPLPGTKLVHTREKRIWKDADKAEIFFSQQLGDKVYEKKFMTAPKIEKLVGKKKFADYSNLVDKVATGVTLVPESDKRPSIRMSAEEEFSS